MVEGAEALAALAGDLDDALRAAGWPGEARAFRPHLTLARSDGLAAGPMVADRLGAAFGTRAIPFSIDRLGLFESVTGGGPARYVPVTERPLAGMH